MSRFVRTHHRILIVVAIIAACVGVQLVTFLKMEPNPVSLVSHDMVSYFTALIQGNSPGLLSRDTIYGNGQFTQSIWYGSAFLYMSSINALFQLAGGDAWVTYGLLLLLTLALYLVVAYVFFAAILPDWRLALALALVSSVVSSFGTTSTFWGIPPVPMNSLHLIPQVTYHVFAMFLAWLVVRWADVAEDGSIRISHWKAAALGALVGISIYAVHSILATATIEVSILTGLVLVLRRRLPLPTVAIYGAVALPFLAFRLLNGSGSTPAISLLSSKMVINSSRTWMLLPWTDRFQRGTMLPEKIRYESLSSLIVLAVVLYVVLSVVSGILALRDRPRRRLWKVVFLAVQAGLCLVFLRAGWLPVLALIYGGLRVWREEEDEPDRIALTVLMFALIAGPIQQTALLFIWSFTGWSHLTAILFEMARFEGLAYLPLYVLVGRAIWELSGAARPGWLRLVVAGALCLLVRANLDTPAIPLGLRSPWHALLGLAALALVAARAITGRLAALRQKPLTVPALIAALAGSAIVLSGFDVRLPLPFIWAGLALAILGLAGLAFLLIPDPRRRLPAIGIAVLLAGYVFVTTDNPLPTKAMRPFTFPARSPLILPYGPGTVTRGAPEENAGDYLAAAQWAKANTPLDSLFHIIDFNANFRVFSQRSILMSYTDPYTLAIYSGTEPSVLVQIWKDLKSLQTKHPEKFTAFLAHNHVDYVLARTGGIYRAKLGEAAECGRRFTPTIAYQNDTYVIYQLASVPDPASTDASVIGLVCPLPPAEIAQAAPAPCGAARVEAGRLSAFLVREYPACAMLTHSLTVKCLSGDGRWSADLVSEINNTSTPGEVAFRAQQGGTCGLFPAK